MYIVSRVLHTELCYNYIHTYGLKFYAFIYATYAIFNQKMIIVQMAITQEIKAVVVLHAIKQYGLH